MWREMVQECVRETELYSTVVCEKDRGRHHAECARMTESDERRSREKRL